MENPFLFGAATSGKWFIDRVEDCERLSANFSCGVNTILISPRRWGKTSLVNKVARSFLDDNIKIVRMDMFSCRSEQDFYQLFVTEVIKQTANKWEEWIENAKQFLSRMSPKISFGNSPDNEVNFSFDFNSRKLDDSVLTLPQKIAEKKNIKIVICIDEFQQISEFHDTITFQKKLRTAWQLQLPTISYCLYGSKKHILNALFSKQSMPFYKFGDVIFLQKIKPEFWIQYICNRFEETKKNISKQWAEEICNKVECHSSYVQQFAWLIWLKTETVVTQAEYDAGARDLLEQNTMLFYTYMSHLTALQLNYLSAIAEGVTDNFSRRNIIEKYQLGNSANIARIKKSLENKEIIDIAPHKITFNDPVFRLWFFKEMKLSGKY
jgi:hypothetical protein